MLFIKVGWRFGCQGKLIWKLVSGLQVCSNVCFCIYTKKFWQICKTSSRWQCDLEPVGLSRHPAGGNILDWNLCGLNSVIIKHQASQDSSKCPRRVINTTKMIHKQIDGWMYQDSLIQILIRSQHSLHSQNISFLLFQLFQTFCLWRCAHQRLCSAAVQSVAHLELQHLSLNASQRHSMSQGVMWSSSWCFYLLIKFFALLFNRKPNLFPVSMLNPHRSCCFP